MTLPLFILILEYVVICACNYRIRGTLFDAFFFVMSPYVFIIAINNIVMTRNGFFEISDSTIWLHGVAILVFYIGSLLGGEVGRSYEIVSPGISYSVDEIDSRLLLTVSVICVLIVLADYCRLIRNMGLRTVLSLGDALSRGFVASHLLVLFLPLMILLVEFFFRETKIRYLLLVLVMLGFIFSTFVKYQVISSVLAVMFYIAITRPKYLKPIGLLILLFIISAFVLNYLISFMAKNDQAPEAFYLRHIWKYVGGGTINIDNMVDYCKGKGELSFFGWILCMIGSFPVMIASGLLGAIDIYHFSTILPLFNVADPSLKEQSNVVSLLGAAYVQSDMLVFLLFSLACGMLVELVYVNALGTSSVRNRVVSSIFLGYCMLSFFSSFFELSQPWEAMVLAWIIITLLRIRL